MPIYEYQCDKCEKTFAKLLLKRDDEIKCPYCGSVKLTKLISSFISKSSDKSRLESFDPSSRQTEDFYHNPKNLGMWAEKRAKELGIDLPEQAHDALDKARSGKLGDAGNLF